MGGTGVLGLNRYFGTPVGRKCHVVRPRLMGMYHLYREVQQKTSYEVMRLISACRVAR